jgi:hypothetical protein
MLVSLWQWVGAASTLSFRFQIALAPPLFLRTDANSRFCADVCSSYCAKSAKIGASNLETGHFQFAACFKEWHRLMPILQSLTQISQIPKYDNIKGE